LILDEFRYINVRNMLSLIIAKDVIVNLLSDTVVPGLPLVHVLHLVRSTYFVVGPWVHFLSGQKVAG